MNWVLWMVQMLSLMGYEEPKVGTPKHFAKGIHPLDICSLSKAEIIFINQYFLTFLGREVLNKSIPLYYSPRVLLDAEFENIGLRNGHAMMVADYFQSNASLVDLDCTINFANFTTNAQVDRIDISYSYWCYEQEGTLKASIIRPAMKIVLLSELDELDHNEHVFTYGFYPPSDIPIDVHFEPEPNQPECRTKYMSVKRQIAYEAYKSSYYSIAKEIDTSNYLKTSPKLSSVFVQPPTTQPPTYPTNAE